MPSLKEEEEEKSKFKGGKKLIFAKPSQNIGTKIFIGIPIQVILHLANIPLVEEPKISQCRQWLPSLEEEDEEKITGKKLG